MQVQKIQNNNNYNTNIITRNNPTFKAKGDTVVIHGAEFIDQDKYLISKLTIDKISKAVGEIESETADNLAILKQFKPEKFKQYLLELIKFVKGEKHAYRVTQEDDGKVVLRDSTFPAYANRKTDGSTSLRDMILQGYVNRDMERFLRKYKSPFVITDNEGKQWVVSSYFTDYSEAAWGPYGVNITPLKYL